MHKITNEMRAIEFNSRIEENKILIPRRMQTEFFAKDDNKVRVVVFLQDQEVYESKAYNQMTKNQFLKGYADSDSVYDL